MDSLYHPRFKTMMNDVVAAGRCTECGSCVVACPHNVIEYVDGKPRQTAKPDAPFDRCGISEGIGCDVCAAVCPRLWPREPHLRDLVPGGDQGYEGIFGTYRHIFVARTRRDDVLTRAQDGGIVTALLAWARECGHIDGAVVAAVGEGDAPCFPSPKVVTTVEQIKASASSWYTYCPNNRALTEVQAQGLEQVAFVGVPCQITPLRKMQAIDPSRLLSVKKKPAIVTRQRGFLRGPAQRVAFSVGLFCTEVFRPELMTERIQGEMGIALTDVAKFNVKGEVRIHTKDGGLAKIPLEEAMAQYQRPECHHCGDFSAELADIACGGVGTDRATIVVLRTQKAVDLWCAFEATGQVQVWPIQAHKMAWNILQRLARRQRERPPAAPDGCGVQADLPPYSAAHEAQQVAQAMATAGKPAAELQACLNAAYADEARPQREVRRVRLPIPGDPGEPAAGDKRKLPPPPTPAQGGASPWIGADAGESRVCVAPDCAQV